jgi:hypothetical protein
MTRLKTTWLASAALGFTFTGTAAAESPREDQYPQEQQEKNTQAPTPQTDADAIDTQLDVDIDTSRTTNPPDIYVAPTPVVVSDDTGGSFYGRYGIAIAAGGGTSGFVNDEMRGATNVGGDWGVRLSVGTRSPLAFEGSYIGSAQSIDALGLSNDALLVGNGVQGALRLNATVDMAVQPFVFAGAAWRRYDLSADTNTSALDDVDNVYEFPVGVGIAGRYAGLMLDLRGEFRPTIGNNLMPELFASDEPFENVGNDNFASMHRWGVNASIGYEF